MLAIQQLIVHEIHVVVNKQTGQIICTAFFHGKHQNFRLFKEFQTKMHAKITAITNTGYQTLQKLHRDSVLPKNKTKNIQIACLVTITDLIYRASRAYATDTDFMRSDCCLCHRR